MLRGWKDLPFVMVNSTTGEETVLPGEGLTVLLEGEVDSALVLLTPSERLFLDSLVGSGRCSFLDRPSPLPNRKKYRRSEGVRITEVCWSITGKCNLRCRHCYMGAPEQRYKDLETEDCLGLIRQMAAANVTRVSLTGGEPLLRPDFWRLVDAAEDEGIRVSSVLTNGVLLDEAFFMNMRRRNLSFGILISYDGLGCHDWMRGVDGTEKKAIEAIKLARSFGHNVTVNMMLHNDNLETLIRTYELLIDLGIQAMRVSTVDDAGCWRKYGSGPIPPERLFEEYLKLVRRFVEDGHPCALQLSKFYHGSPTDGDKIICVLGNGEKNLDSSACPYMREHPCLMPNGRLLPCPSFSDTHVEQNMPNLLEVPLASIYSNPEGYFWEVADTKLADVVERDGECVDCPHKFECGGGACRAGAAIQCGDFRGSDKLVCGFFKDGWRRRLESVIYGCAEGFNRILGKGLHEPKGELLPVEKRVARHLL
ncbi:MAG: radical SAM protein [Synergistaceae bacterium]|jgi:radical SAM protein with 4Fe4S-binding SPASM domain|nr:radical SAM protein [Synergistaceae bacterium]